MLGNFITLPHLLIFFPLVAGIIAFFIKSDSAVKGWSIFSSLLTLAVSLASLFYIDNAALNGLAFNYEWLKYIGASFSVSLDGAGRVLTFLTAFSFPVIFIATYQNSYAKSNIFYGLMLLSQAGLMGVFLASDALLFYFFWELALIPVYFLCSRWGGEKRIAATWKFFIYTFVSSLLMLVGIIYVYLQTTGTATSEHSFSIYAFYKAVIASGDQDWLFWLFFIAFAVKMPVFPFHTWQPDTYEQSPAPATMVLSGIMVKMGVFAVIRWVFPVVTAASYQAGNIVTLLAVIGIVYASLIAIRQDDLKRLVAYSSIAHMGMMCAGLFTQNPSGLQGVML